MVPAVHANRLELFATEKQDILSSNERNVNLPETRHFGRLGFVEIGALSVGWIVQTNPLDKPFQRGQESPSSLRRLRHCSVWQTRGLCRSAAAGPYTAEIENVTKLLASRDAGSGPTAGPMGTTTGQHPPTSAMGAADSSTAASAAAAESAKPQHPPTAAMNEATQGGGASPRAGETVREQHPPTAAMNEATQGAAASPQDVQRQTRGGPTAAQQAEGARRTAKDQLASAQRAVELASR